jgi:hypothetical protein
MVQINNTLDNKTTTIDAAVTQRSLQKQLCAARLAARHWSKERIACKAAQKKPRKK